MTSDAEHKQTISVDGKLVSRIGPGIVALIGVGVGEVFVDAADAAWSDEGGDQMTQSTRSHHSVSEFSIRSYGMKA